MQRASALVHCDDPNLSLGERGACWLAHEPNPMIFQILVGNARGKAMPVILQCPRGFISKHHPRRGSFHRRFGDEAYERCKNLSRIGLAMWIWLTSIMSRAR